LTLQYTAKSPDVSPPAFTFDFKNGLAENIDRFGEDFLPLLKFSGFHTKIPARFFVLRLDMEN